jgi:cytoskeleton protein RodZ
MESVGTIIKLARESRKLSLRQAAEATRISGRHLQSIEEGRYRDLPGGMYNRAFVRAYAEYLGLDAQAILERFATEAPSPDRQPRPKIAVTQPSKPSHGYPVLAWSVMLLISVAGIFFSRHWIAEVFSPYFSRSPAAQIHPPVAAPETKAVQERPAPAPPPSVQSATTSTTPVQSTTAPPVSGTTEPAPQAAAAPAEPAPQQLPAAEPEVKMASASGRLQIHLQATENCWTSVTSDSTRVLSAELKPGDEHSFGAEHQFTIVLGNAGAVRLSINGKPARPLGKPGQVVKVLITEQNLGEYLSQNP